MLRTRIDLETELANQLMISNNSTLFDSTRITDLIQKSTIWAGGVYFWPSLQRARVTTAAANTQGLKYDYYDYPPDFYTDSISRIYIDGKKYNIKRYQDFLDYVDATNSDSTQPDKTQLYASMYGRQYFIWPSYTGSPPANNLIVWGNVQHPDLLNSTDTTIFSNWDERGNEAIVKKAFQLGMGRLNPQDANAALQEAMSTLALLWQKVTQELQKGQALNHPFFAVPDMYGQLYGVSSIGTFSDIVW